MKKVNVYEDNGGMVHVIVEEDGTPINIISGFEDGLLSKDEFIAAAQEGFDSADEYDADNYSGLSSEDVAAEISEQDDLIAEITPDSVELYAEKMGCAGKCLFEVEDG